MLIVEDGELNRNLFQRYVIEKREAAARGPVAIPQPGIPVFRRSGDDEGVEAYASMFRPLGFSASAG